MNIKTTIDRIEGDRVILKTKNGETIIWPKDQLPEKIHEGMVFTFKILDEKEEEIENKKTAKDILNEILDTNK